jgi:hypothetical protein
MNVSHILTQHDFRAADGHNELPQGWQDLLRKTLLKVRRGGYKGKFLHFREVNAGLRVELVGLIELPEVLQELLQEELDMAELESLWTCKECGVNRPHTDGRPMARTFFLPGNKLGVYCNHCHRKLYPHQYRHYDTENDS